MIVTSPGSNFVTLKIETDEGVWGIGDATLNGREKAVDNFNFALKNPNHGYIKYWDLPKVAALKKLYPSLYSPTFQTG